MERLSGRRRRRGELRPHGGLPSSNVGEGGSFPSRRLTRPIAVPVTNPTDLPQLFVHNAPSRPEEASSMHLSASQRLFVLYGLMAALTAPGIAAAQATEPDPKTYWDVNDIRPGMKGTGRTVMTGTKLEVFG